MGPRIVDMVPDQRPRERLRDRGPSGLSEAELLAVVLRTGRRGHSAVDEAQALLAAAGGLEGVARMSPKELERRPGMGRAKAAAVCAALELGRRIEPIPMGRTLDRPEEAGRVLVGRLRGNRREVFGIISLDSRHRMIQEHRLWEGTRNQVSVDPTEVFRTALLDDAAGLIVFHSHPSGVTAASRDDLELTRRLVRAGRELGLEILDHLIIAGPDWVSLRVTHGALFQAGA